jgi:hypothetical protein
LKEKIDAVTLKACLCEDLAATASITCPPHEKELSPAVAVCPGPNLAFFSKICSLEEMVGHIYGRTQLLSSLDRPNVFINEVRLYADYLKNEINKKLDSFTAKEQKYFSEFKSNMLEGIAYYKSIVPKLSEEAELYRKRMHEELLQLEQELLELMIPAARS